MSKSFCYLKGIVECSEGRIQDCNMKHVNKCMLEEEKAKEDSKMNGFCYLKGMVSCPSSRIQDCNTKRVKTCLKD